MTINLLALAAFVLASLAAFSAAAVDTPKLPLRLLAEQPKTPDRTLTMEGWTVHVRGAMLDQDRAGTEKALAMLRTQLAEIVRVVPAAAVAKLREVPLWISPEYPGVSPRAEYHPDAGWLRSNGRDPAMAKSVEFTNVRIYETETRRMPVFVLHELAHSYHDRVLTGGFENAEVKAAYEHAKTAGLYDRIERWHGDGRPNTFERAYAMTNQQEYFAETTEAFFGRNDFFPFTATELAKHDPEMFAVLKKIWGAPLAPARPAMLALPVVERK